MAVSNSRLSRLLICCSSFYACGGDGSRTTTAQSVTISFAARAGSTDVRCDLLLENLGASKSKARLKDFRFYVSDVNLIGTNGKTYPLNLDENEWQTAGLALLDFQDKADNCEGEAKTLHTKLTGTVSSDASAQTLRFTIGIPTARNHIDIAQAQGPLNVASMYWSWQGGYKFMRLDVAPEGGITRPSNPDFSATVYNFHLGSTDCEGEPEAGEAVSCARLNQPIVSLADFNPAQNTVVLNYAALVSQLNLASDQQNTPGCMSETTDPECSEFFKNLGLDLLSGQAAADQQQIFSVD